MNTLDAVKDQFTTASADVGVLMVLANLLAAAILAFLLRLLYIRCGSSLSNRRTFGNNFVLLACTTTLIITVVKSSLALSLGLVGALSIVRFRSAIKEPEELAYLFLTIAIGLGMGADQLPITIASFVLIAILIFLGARNRAATQDQNLYLTVSGSTSQGIELSQIVDVLTANCGALNLRRFDLHDDTLDAAFMVEFDDFSQFDSTQKALRGLSGGLDISFSEYRGTL